MAPPVGFEPTTCPLGGDCAIQLCHEGVIPITVTIGLLLQVKQIHSYAADFFNPSANLLAT